MYLLFSLVAAAAFAQGGGNGGGNGPIPVTQLGSTCDNKRTKPLDVFFLVDGSSSIGKNGPNYQEHERDPSEWPGQLRFIEQLVKHSLTVEGDRVGIWQFALNGEQKGRLEFTLGTPVNTVVEGVKHIEQIMGGTPTKEAVQAAVHYLKTAPVTQQDRDRLIVILTDGEPTCRDDQVYSGCHDPCHNLAGNPLTDTVDMLDDEDIMTVVIGVNNDGAKLKCLVDDPEENIVKISDFHSFGEYKDPTGDENLLCVNPKELELNCCRVAVTTPELFNMHDKLCQKKGRIECLHSYSTVKGACDWGITMDGEFIEGCGVDTYRPTPEPTDKPTRHPTAEPTAEPTMKPSAEPTMKPTLKPTNKPTAKPSAKPTPAPVNPTSSPTKKAVCEPLNNCVVKGGVKVFGWNEVGGKKKASSACACADACVNAGGSESKWHVKRKICKCWKSSTHIEMKFEPYDANKKHGGNAGGKTQCVKSGNSSADITQEKQVTIVAKTRSPTVAKAAPIPPPPAPTPSTPQKTLKVTAAPSPATPQKTIKPSTVAEYQEHCAKKKATFLKSTMSTWCTWVDAKCDFQCA